VDGPVAPNPEERFTHRVADYVLYRPGYPGQLIDWLRAEIGLSDAWDVADIGSGTGIFAARLLPNVRRVYGVEPNTPMRTEAEKTLSSNESFVSVNGTAEATTLGDASVNLVTAAQAFHWFDPAPTRREWIRILKPPRHALIVFNSRRIHDSPFMRAYDQLLIDLAVDYKNVDHRQMLEGRIHAFLGDGPEWHHHFTLSHTFEAVRGLSGSSSYVPAPAHPRHAAFMERLRAIFDEHAVNGRVEFLYETEAYCGTLR